MISVEHISNKKSVSHQPPYAAAILILGIFSICICWMWGVPGIVLGVVSLALYNKSHLLLKKYPEKYSTNSGKIIKAGFICSIAGVIFSTFFLFLVFFFLIILLVAAIVSQSESLINI